MFQLPSITRGTYTAVQLAALYHINRVRVSMTGIDILAIEILLISKK